MIAPVRVSSPRLVGRREEIARLEAMLDAARSGRPATVVVTGDAGIGKSRLVREFLGRAEAVGARTLIGACADVADGVLPYGPFVDLLRDLVRTDGVGRVLQLAGPTGHELARLAPALAAGGEVPPALRSSQTGLYLALLGLLEGLAVREPLVLVLEDLHWAGHSTCDLVSLLARNLRGAVLLVVTARSDESPADDRVRRFLGELGRLAAVRLPLGPLDRGDQARQIGAILGVPPTTAFVDDVHARAEGNPFFAEELVALGAGAPLPTALRDLLLARVGTLSDDAQHVVRVAATAGRRVSYGLLAHVSDLDTGRLDRALREAVEQHVLVPAGDAFAFRHALLREAIETTALPGEAARVHRRLAEGLSEHPELSGDDGHALATRVAHHWHLAGDEVRTLVASLTAAGAAEQALAWPAALANYDRAIALIDRIPDAAAHLGRPRYRILWSAAEAAHLAAYPQRAAALIRQAIAAIDLDRPEHPDTRLHHAYLHERLGRYLWMSADGVGALAAYERAVALVPDDEPTCWRAAVSSGYGQMLMLAGRFSESVRWCREAIAMAAVVERSRSTEGHARNSLGVALAALGHVDEGIAHLREARRIAEEEFEDVDDIARAIVNLHTVLIGAGRLEEAAAVALEGVTESDRLGLTRRKGVWCRCDAADALLRLGRVGEAERLLTEAQGLEPAGIDALRTSLLLAQFHLVRGDTPAAERHAAAARAAGGSLLDPQFVGPLATIRARLALHDDPSQALATVDAGLAQLGEHPDAEHTLPLILVGVRAAVEAALAAGGGRAAATARDELARLLALAEGCVAADQGRRPEPRACLATARAEATRASARPQPELWSAARAAWAALAQPFRTAYCEFRGAEAHLALGERDAARALLASASETARTIGADGLAADAAQLARRAGISAEVPVESGDGFRLTAREREVLALVAEGHTDRQIGESLFISHRTVERHVSNILAKLQASTRSEATAIAHRGGLVTAPR